VKRWNIWQANALKCSEYREPELQNCNLANIIPRDKFSLAECLNYKNYVEMNMELKMVGSFKNLQNFFDTLLAAGILFL
jgi:Zn-dependent oligopeptidase